MTPLLEQSETSVRVFAPRWRLALLLLGGLALVAGSVWMGLREDGVVIAVIGWSGAVFFAGCLLFVIKRAVRRMPILVFDEAGFVDNATALAVGRVEWREVSAISICSISGNRFLGIDVDDSADLLRRVAAWRRPIIQLNARMGFPPIAIPQSLLPLKVEELAEILERLLDRARSLEA